MRAGLERSRSGLGFLEATAVLLAAGGLSAQVKLKENLDLPYEAVGCDIDDGTVDTHSFLGVLLEGDGFFYVIDRSRTMQDAGQLDRAKQEVLKNIREFSDRVQFGIFFFDRSVLKFPPGGQPATASPAMKAAAASFVQAAPPGAGTCGKEALLDALRMANLARTKRKVIVYLSDGGGTCMNADESEYLEQTLSAVAAANVQRVKINTIGVLDVAPEGERFLKELAAQNGGTYTRIR